MVWVKNVVWWHAYPLGLTGATIRGHDRDAPVQSRLTRLENWLDYAIELGCSGLMLGPIFDSESHGYDTIDHFRIDPRLGDLEDFDRLVLEAKARGMRICLDGVFNHVGKPFAQYQEAVQKGPGSPAADWFHLDYPADWTPGTEPDYQRFEGHGPLVELNHGSQAVIDHVVEVMKFWSGRGVDAWRLDAAYAVEPEFWREVLGRVRAKFPKTWVVGEVISGDYVDIVERSDMSTVTQYELWKAIWSSLHDGNFYEFSHALGRHLEFMKSFVPQTFIGNHDVTRVADLVGGQDKARVAALMLMTMPGVPSVYYGDEQGFTGVKTQQEAGDDSVRPPLPDSPAQLSRLGHDTYQTYRAAISLRRRHPWLHRCTVEVDSLENTRIVYRCLPDRGKFGAEAKIQEEFLTVSLDITDKAAARVTNSSGLVEIELPAAT